jgi:aryl-alcohol dehydrogenase-like predicted oxidoreductase
VPLASGLLTGKLTKETVFDESDHRRFNRHGESFDVGETFAGVDYETGLAVVDELRALVPAGATLAQMALRWILMSEAVTAAIPGAKTPEQARANAAAADLAALPDAAMEQIASLYRERVRPLVHQRW